MDTERELPPFEELSETLLDAIDKVLAKKTTLKTAEDFQRAMSDAKIKTLQTEWTAAYNAANPPTDTVLNYAQTVRDKLKELVKLRTDITSNTTQGGRRRRKYTRRYCKKTPCRKMGFTQKASCRPYKNCYRKSTRS